MTYSRRKAAAVEAVVEIELTAHTAPRRDPARPAVRPYKPIGYGPEKVILTLLGALVIFAGLLAAVEYHHWHDLPAEIEHTMEGIVDE